MHKNNSGHRKAAVRRGMVFLLFIDFISERNDFALVYTHADCKVSSFLACTDFVFQTLDDLIADRGGFGIGHRFIRLIGQAVRQRLLPGADLFIAIHVEQADLSSRSFHPSAG